MRNAFAIILKFIAGFFFYAAGLVAFVRAPAAMKWGIMATFIVLAFLALAGGLAATRFQNWRTNVGIVLLSASGVTAFIIFTFVCLLLTDDFRKLMRPGTLTLFSDYATGAVVIVVCAGIGWLFIRADRKYHMQIGAAEARKGGAPPS